MRIVTISPGFPDPSRGGGGNWGSVLLKEFARLGYDVTHIGVLGKHDSIKFDATILSKYNELGIDTVHVPYVKSAAKRKNFFAWIKALLFPSPQSLFPNEYQTGFEVKRQIKKIDPDCVISFAWDAAIYSDGLNWPRVGIQAEGEHINVLVNLMYDPPTDLTGTIKYTYYRMTRRMLSRAYERLATALASRMTVAVYQGAHYVEWARANGLKNVGFITTPVPRPHINTLKGGVYSDAERENRKIRLLAIGHLGSTSNRSGLPLLFEELLPSLEKLIGSNGFEIHIVGDNDLLPRRYECLRNHPSLVWKGVVYPADTEFLSADLLIVPVPAPTGSRVRIINGFSYGCAIVAHSANKLAMPELVNGKNIMLGDTGFEMAKLIVEVARNEDLKGALGRNGKETFDRFYAVEPAMRQYDAAVKQAVAMHAFYQGTKKLSSLAKWRFPCVPP